MNSTRYGEYNYIDSILLVGIAFLIELLQLVTARYHADK